MNLLKRNLNLSTMCLVLVILLITVLLLWWFQNHIHALDHQIKKLQNF